MNSSAIKRLIKTSLGLEKPEPIYISGPPGIGKSSLPIAVAKETDANVIIWPSAPTLDSVDIRGLLRVVTADDCNSFGLNKNLIGSTVSFPPDFLPRSVDKKTIIVIDDLPTATQSVQAALLQLILDRKLGSYTLPKECMFVITGNRLEDKAGAARTITALDSRVVRVDMEVSTDDWLEWAKTSNIVHSVILFHKHYKGKYLWMFDPNNKCNPLPRTWEKASVFIEAMGPDNPDLLGVLQGIVGEEAANMFFGFLSVIKEVVPAKVILSNPTKAEIPTDPAALMVTLSNLARSVDSQTLGAFFVYIKRLGMPEYGAMAVQEAMDYKPVLKETAEYTKFCQENKTLSTL